MKDWNNGMMSASRSISQRNDRQGMIEKWNDGKSKKSGNTYFSLCSIIFLSSFFPEFTFAQTDTLNVNKSAAADSGKAVLNMDAIYDRPFLRFEKIPVAIGGYAEMNTQYENSDGVSEGFSFQMRRMSLFVSSAIQQRLRFLTEIEFEDGTKEINIETAILDFEFHPALNLRGGIILNPIGSFNQNHDGPKWDFIDRPLVSTQILPATWSNAGAGFFGRLLDRRWIVAYEAYLTNGFDDRIISNEENKTFLAASKANRDRFEESSNGMPLFTGKIALRNRKFGEAGVSYMGGVYNSFKKDGLPVDDKRRVHAVAADLNVTVPGIQTNLTAEAAWVRVEVPETYSQQFGEKQWGVFVDVIQPVLRKNIFGFEKSVIQAGIRFEYVDWNVAAFNETGENISDDLTAVVPSIAWRPGGQTVVRFNYRYQWQQDLLGNPAARTAVIQFGISSYF